jgi:hypothetical protein
LGTLKSKTRGGAPTAVSAAVNARVPSVTGHERSLSTTGAGLRQGLSASEGLAKHALTLTTTGAVPVSVDRESVAFLPSAALRVRVIRRAEPASALRAGGQPVGAVQATGAKGAPAVGEAATATSHCPAKGLSSS